MSTNHHTPIANGAAANAATFNPPLSQLDTKITSQETAILLRAIVWAGKTTAPTANDDTGDGIKVGDRWLDETNNQEYVCVDATLGAAIWQQTTKTTNVSTYIDGLVLTWDSATSITVNKGSCYAEDGSFIDVTSALIKSALSLSASTWYHVYVYLSGGTPTAEVVTTAPVAWKGNAYSKTGATSRRYVGSIKSDGSGNVYEFLYSSDTNGMYYRNVAAAAAPFRVLTTGTATTATAVALSSLIPVTARIARLRFFNGGTQTAYANESNAVSTSIYYMGINPVAIQQHGLMPIDASQQIYYLVTAGGNMSIDILGYEFKR